VLRRYRRPVRGQALAEELGVSIRTLYRDIASLQAQGAMIEGEPRVGYVMKAGFMLPPMMFRSEELDALILGMRWVADRCDKTLSSGALSTLAKIAAILPTELRRELEESSLLVGAPLKRPAHKVSPDILRAAVREEQKLNITYVDASGIHSQRVVWPFALVYFDQARVLMCWCELRADKRRDADDVDAVGQSLALAARSRWESRQYIFSPQALRRPAVTAARRVVVRSQTAASGRRDRLLWAEPSRTPSDSVRPGTNGRRGRPPILHELARLL
jgi:biotin operon repressor